MSRVGKLRNYSTRTVSGTERQSSTCRMKRWCPAKMVPSVGTAQRERLRERERERAFLWAGRGSLPNRLISIRPPCLRSSLPLTPSPPYGAERGWNWGPHSVINFKHLTCPALWPYPFCQGVGGNSLAASQHWQSQPWENEMQKKSRRGGTSKCPSCTQIFLKKLVNAATWDGNQKTQQNNSHKFHILCCFKIKVAKMTKTSFSVWQDSSLCTCGWVWTLGLSLWSSQPCLLFLWEEGYNRRAVRETGRLD